MPKIKCPACQASGALCSTCNGRRFVELDAAHDWRDSTETDADYKRVSRDIARWHQLLTAASNDIIAGLDTP
jgi:hypothetical protein